MAKRRTKKEKIKATHNFQISWQPSLNKANSEANVKRQLDNPKKTLHSNWSVNKNAVASAQDYDLVSIKRDIVKSLSLTALILCVELMI